MGRSDELALNQLRIDGNSMHEVPHDSRRCASPHSMHCVGNHSEWRRGGNRPESDVPSPVVDPHEVERVALRIPEVNPIKQQDGDSRFLKCGDDSKVHLLLRTERFRRGKKVSRDVAGDVLRADLPSRLRVPDRCDHLLHAFSIILSRIMNWEIQRMGS